MLLQPIDLPFPDAAALGRLADGAGRAIPPLWPLAASVAVNPYLGQSGEGLAQTAARLARAGGIAVTMPRPWYAGRIAAGTIRTADLEAALAAAPEAGRPASPAALMELASAPALPDAAIPTVADLAATATGTDWPALLADRIGVWAGSHYDAGQALWAPDHASRAFCAWRAQAMHDLTPEIAGLPGFCAFVAGLPEDPLQALARAIELLGAPTEALPGYFHRLLTTLGGWAQFARYLQFSAEVTGGTDSGVTDLLAIRLVWDAALLRQFGGLVGSDWTAALAAHALPVGASADHSVNAILQEAVERAAQREIAALLAVPGVAAATDMRPALQAAFCIDVRSEVFRRALEAVDPSIRTIGFAGFFGLGTAHRGLGSDVVEARLPVLLAPGLTSVTGAGTQADGTRIEARANRAWGRFRQAAVSSFAFVEAMGPVYAGKLVRDALGLAAPAAPQDPAPRFDPPLDLATRIGAANAVLRAMSLTEGFAPLVLIAGHGANVTNNPHASGLHCGACGGYSGEVNARLLAGLLNDPEVRAGLVAHGIAIPADTRFLPGLHDTTTDAITLYEDDLVAGADLARLRGWLAAAGAMARDERARRLPGARSGADLPERSRNWAEVRPEWGLAGCRAFIAAPRLRTHGRDLGGRAFLHDYDWQKDEGFGVLELILTAPVVVASWISLQYYGSTVAPAAFGGGNKLLHNVVGGIGVLEGNGGAPRPGLPWQSVQDGEALQHEPLRLSVLVEAPRAAITDILARHPGVKDLFDNGWLHLFALDDAGRMAWRYRPGLNWEAEV